jgi:hypothetical protein
VIATRQLGDDLDVRSPTALVYETAEEARLLLRGSDGELAGARTAAGEAGYYLSDTIEPDERVALLALAERRSGPAPADEEADAALVMEALTLLEEATGEVEQMLGGPNASSELRIARQALRRAIGHLSGHRGPETDHLDLDRGSRAA